MLNLVHHKNDFNLDASWAFTATGHGKGAGDGVGAVLKSTARRITLSKNILLSTPYDFFTFSKNQQLQTAKAAGKDHPAIDIFFLEEKQIQRTKLNVLNERLKQFKTTGTSNLLIFLLKLTVLF